MGKLIQAATSRTVAAAATDDLIVPLKFERGMHNYIVGATVYVDQGIWTGMGGTAITPVIFDAEIWLQSGGAKIPLDKGWVCYDAKYNRAVIGFAGRYEFFENDTLLIPIQNAGTGSGAWGASYSLDVSKEPVSDIGTRFTLSDDVTFIYQARRINTQTAAGPAALYTRVSMNPGQIGRFIASYVVGAASAGAPLLQYMYDEDNAIAAQLTNIAAGASRSACLPSVGTVSTGNSNLTNSQGLILAPGQFFVTSTSVSLNTETLTVFFECELLNDPTLPVWDTTGSGGTPSLAASTISVANTLQPIIRPRMIG